MYLWQSKKIVILWLLKPVISYGNGSGWEKFDPNTTIDMPYYWSPFGKFEVSKKFVNTAIGYLDLSENFRPQK